MNQGLVGSGRYRENAFADTIPKLFPHNQRVADFLKDVHVSPEDYYEALLSGVGMSPSWRRRGKMAIFFYIVDGKCLFLPLFCIYPVEATTLCFYALRCRFFLIHG